MRLSFIMDAGTDSLTDVIQREVESRFFKKPDAETIYSIRMSVLKDVADILSLPYYYFDKNDVVILEQDHVDQLREIWNRVLDSCDYRISNDEIAIAERFESTGRFPSQKDLQKFLNVLFKKNCIEGQSNDKSEQVLKLRHLNTLLAVDGFAGYMPSQFQNYITNLDCRKPHYLKIHCEAVRKMYNAFKDVDVLSGLTGTDSACVVYLALLRLLLNTNDHQIQLIVEKLIKNAEGYLQTNARYYRDIRSVEHELDTLGQIYVHCVNSEQVVRRVLYEKLNSK